MIDGTLGAGGHSASFLQSVPTLRVLGVDQDPEILALAGRRLAEFGERARLVRGRISELPRIAAEAGLGPAGEPVVGVLFDLGVSSLQLDSAERGFSFQGDGPLDMRMDPSRDRTAADIVNEWDEADLADLFYHEGGETRSRRIARALCESRRRARFERTSQLASMVERILPRKGRVHPATRVFQALRRAVNEEGEELLAGLEAAEALLVDGGRLAVISFHSGEDAVVKRWLRGRSREGNWRLLTKKPVQATREEVLANRRARSARLRIAERTRPEPESGA